MELLTKTLITLLVITFESDSLGHRNAHSLVYHESEERIYLFGGASHQEVLGDLWVFETDIWQKVEVETGPAPRTFAAAAYDSNVGRLMVFGGSKVLFGNKPDPANLFDDLWGFVNNRWQRMETSQTPTSRAEASMVYDRRRDRLVLFGGNLIDEDGQYIKLGDTWEYDGNDWQLLSASGPTARHGVSMWYDSVTEQVMLFGGSIVDRQYGAATGETWSWGGKQWVLLLTQQPPGIFNAAIASTPSGVLRFGGSNGQGRSNETWVFKDGTWLIQPSTDPPAARNHASIVFDTKNDRVVLFGGHDGRHVFGDTWSWQNGEWSVLTDRPAVPRVANRH